MKKYHSFGKSALPALLITILIGTTLGCPDDSSEDDPILQSIAVTSPPTKTVYVKDEPLDLDGLVVTGTYSGGTTKVETVTISNISGYNANTVGQQPVTVTINGKTATFTVTVNNTALQSIAVTSQPTKTVYTQGEALNLSGLVVTGTYADGTSKAETVGIANVSGYNANTTGTQTLTVTLNGKTATFTVTVNAGGAVLQSIAITSPPTKTVYAPGEALNLSGLVVTGTYTNGTTKTETVGIADISGYDANTTGTQTLTVTVGGKTAIFTVSVNVILQNITEVITELTNVPAPGGLIAANPVSLRLGLNLTTRNWEDLLEGIAAVGKYVSLDLSACTMSVTEFAPGTGAGADRVAALVLPDAAKSIKAGNWDNPTFKAFTALRSLSGVSVETLGGYAFKDCTSLTKVSLPAATSIGYEAFRGCTNLAEVSLPAATTIAYKAFSGCGNLTTITIDPANTAFTAHDGMLLNKAGTTLIAYPSASGDITIPFVTDIGYAAFSDCESLTSVSLPVATTVDHYAFRGCTNLTEVNLPVATTIGVGAFSDYDESYCTSLTSVSLPAATYINDRAFSYCTSLTEVSLPATPPSIPTGSDYGIFRNTNSDGTITVRVSAGAVSAYTSAWGVSANTSANGYSSKYGSNHKAVIITDGAQ
jgi:hypothetical protein